MSFSFSKNGPLAWPRAVHRRLLPDDPNVGWTPYLWLFYLSVPILSWIRIPDSPGLQALGALSLAVFLVLYFNGYWRWTSGKSLRFNIAGLVLLGIVWTPFISAAMVFFIYAASFAGAARPQRVGWWIVLSICIVVLLNSVVFDQPWWRTILTLCFCVMIGAANIYFAAMGRKNADLRRSREEVEALATIAERERISRDLHDLLGHTLSLITLKAELARKLSERGDAKATAEIADVERISREALRQVREAVEGYRKSGLDGELARARLACEAREIEFSADVAAIDLESRHEATLAMVLREAVTNVVRHSRASFCRIALARSRGAVSLTVHNDGVARSAKRQDRARLAGHGLLGMRERLSQVGGELHIETADGWLLEARIPVDGLREKEKTPEKHCSGTSAASTGRLAAEPG